MSEEDRLKRTLAKLAAPAMPVTAEGRELQIGTGAGEGPLAAVLTEVDETLLARRLSFRTDADPAFALDVYGRRLLRVVPPVPDGAPGAALAGRELEGLEDADRALLRDLLEAMTTGAGRLWVTAAPLPEARDPAVLGVSAQTLATAWSLELGGGLPPAPATALDRILESAGDKALAWLRLAGEASTSGGDAAAIARLEAFAATGLHRARDSDGDVNEPRCTFLGRQDASGALLVLAEAGGEALLMLVRSAHVPAVTQAWRSVFR